MASSDVFDRTEQWTRSILEALGVPSSARGTGGAPLTISLDEPEPVVPPRQRRVVIKTSHAAAQFDDVFSDDDLAEGIKGRRAPARRDSLRRREALLRGKEGSRQRRRWENSHLMHVPNAQPPLPCDWEVHPTHTVHNDLPYHVAQYWDLGLRHYVNETRAAAAVLRRNQIIAQQSGISVLDKAKTKPKKNKKAKKVKAGPTEPIATGAEASKTISDSSSSPPLPATFGMVTRHLRSAAKKTPAVKLWVRALELPIRQYVLAAESSRRGAEPEAAQLAESDDGEVVDDATTITAESDSDDEIVFIGRRILGQHQTSWKRASQDADDEKVDSGILFDELGDGEKGSFKRWLAHSLSDYYGLNSTSSTISSPGKPGNRVVYVALREETTQSGAGPILIPRPMWELFEAL